MAERQEEVPAWTLADRLRKARMSIGLEQGELASEIGISRASVSNYEIGKFSPSRPILLSWALRCRVPLGWLITGDAPPDSINPGDPIKITFPYPARSAA